MSLPYEWIIGGVGALALVGGVYALNADKNHYKNLYNTDETTIVGLHNEIKLMTEAQNVQTDQTEKTIEKVVTVPGATKTIIQTIHDAPEPANCATPELPQNVKDML